MKFQVVAGCVATGFSFFSLQPHFIDCINDFFYKFALLYERDRRDSIDSSRQQEKGLRGNACSQSWLSIPLRAGSEIWIRKTYRFFKILATLSRLRAILILYSKLRQCQFITIRNSRIRSILTNHSPF